MERYVGTDYTKDVEERGKREYIRERGGGGGMGGAQSEEFRCGVAKLIKGL